MVSKCYTYTYIGQQPDSKNDCLELSIPGCEIDIYSVDVMSDTYTALEVNRYVKLT